MELVIQPVTVLFTESFRVISIFAVTSVMKIRHYTLTAPAWMIAIYLTSTDINGAMSSAIILVLMGGTFIGTEPA